MEYLDEATMVPKNTSVLIQRVPGRPRMNIVTQPNEPIEEHKVVDPEPVKSSYLGADSAGMQYPDDTDWDEFGNDLYAIPDVIPIQSSNQIMDAPPSNTIDEENKIRALIETPAVDWQHQGADGLGAGRGFGRSKGGRMMNGRGFGRFGMEKKTPPPGYICHRCNVGGHLIQHCATNGDPSYDVRRVKPRTGIPKSMLMATPDGSYSLPSGAVAVLRPNEAAFEKEIEGLPSTRYIGELPPEFHCPLCKEVMKDAVLTSKCCFKSFCDKFNYISKKTQDNDSNYLYSVVSEITSLLSQCVFCGATNILADDLLPNKTLRDTINRILESGNSSAENAGSTYQVQDMESALYPQPKIPSPSYSAASKGQSMPPPRIEETLKMNETASEGHAATAPQHTSDKGRNAKVEDMCEATHDSMSVKEPTSQGSAPLAEEEVQHKVASIDADVDDYTDSDSDTGVQSALKGNWTRGLPPTKESLYHGTIIAVVKYGGGKNMMIAADTRLSDGYGIVGNGQKLFVLGRHVMGCTGIPFVFTEMMRNLNAVEAGLLPFVDVVTMLVDFCNDYVEAMGMTGNKNNRRLSIENDYLLCGYSEDLPKIYAISHDSVRYVAREEGESLVLGGWGRMRGSAFHFNKSEAWRHVKRTIFSGMMESIICGGNIDRINMSLYGCDLQRNVMLEQNTNSILQSRLARNRRIYLRKSIASFKRGAMWRRSNSSTPYVPKNWPSYKKSLTKWMVKDE